MNEEMSTKKIVGLIVGGFIGLFIVLPLLWSSWGTIDAGERGVRLRMGAVVGTVEEGFYTKIPYVESVKTMDVKVQKDEVEAGAASKDLQTVSSKLAINYNLSPDYVANIYKTVGKDYKVRLLDPAVRTESPKH